jgi:hypothetical protein
MKITFNKLSLCNEERDDVLKERHAIIYFLKNQDIDTSIIDKLRSEQHWICGAPYNTKGYFDEEAFYKVIENLKSHGYDKRPLHQFKEIDDDEFVYDEEIGNALNERSMIISFLKRNKISLIIINSLRSGKHWALGSAYGPGGCFDYGE